jgi:hypothetical protein
VVPSACCFHLSLELLISSAPFIPNLRATCQVSFLSTPLSDRSWLIKVGPELASVQKSFKRFNMGPIRRL